MYFEDEKSNVTFQDLFGKYTEGNLNKKGLQKAGKNERVEIIESNLEFLCEFYFGRGQSKDRDKLNHVYELIGSEKYFLKPLAKIIKKAKKDKDIEIPKELHVILNDTIDKYRALRQQRMQRMMGSQNVNTEYSHQASVQLKEKYDNLIEQLAQLESMLCLKEAKKLMKMGFMEEYAFEVAKAMIPSNCLTKYNIGRYFHNLNSILVKIARIGYVKNENETGEESYRNLIGIDITDKEVIGELYNMFFKGVDRNVYLIALGKFLLEMRGKFIQNFTKFQKEVWNRENELVTDILEGEAVISIDKNKKAKKQLVTKKELKKIMRFYSDERMKDLKHGRDGQRRILIKSLSTEEYPRLIKAFEDTLGDSIDEDFEMNTNQNNGNANNNKQNQNRNGNNNQKNNTNQRNNNHK